MADYEYIPHDKTRKEWESYGMAIDPMVDILAGKIYDEMGDFSNFIDEQSSEVKEIIGDAIRRFNKIEHALMSQGQLIKKYDTNNVNRHNEMCDSFYELTKFARKV